jgi:CRP/FNR family transcriptional regulator, cyclic AMP receptor protein
MRKVLFILGELSDKDVDWMMAAGKRERIPPGAALIQEGKPVEALYIVLEGLLRVSVESAGSRELARLGSGEIIGEMSFVDARPPSATVKALENSMVLSISRSQLAAKLEREADFAARFYRALAIFLSSRLREMDQAQSAAGQYDPDELDPNVLDTVHLAGARFERMLKRSMTG